jgi:hypothetical protein
VKVKHPDLRNVDLLIIFDQHIPDGISKYMSVTFPCSAQCRAMNVFTEEVIDDTNLHLPYIVVHPHAVSTAKYLKKYMKYYPDKLFYQLIERPEEEENPFDIF